MVTSDSPGTRSRPRGSVSSLKSRLCSQQVRKLSSVVGDKLTSLQKTFKKELIQSVKTFVHDAKGFRWPLTLLVICCFSCFLVQSGVRDERADDPWSSPDGGGRETEEVSTALPESRAQVDFLQVLSFRQAHFSLYSGLPVRESNSSACP